MSIVRRCLSNFARACGLICVAVVFTTASARAADAKEGDKKEEPPTHDYTMPYFVTGVAVTLAVLPLCWPAMRRWDLPLHEED